MAAMKRAGATAVCLMVLTTSCSTDTPAAPTATPTTPRTTNAAAASDCLAVSPQMAQRIIAGAVDGSGISAGPASAVKSSDHGKVYIVAVRVKIPGVGDEVGTWATNSLTGAGLILAVDGLAKQFTDWPAADTTDAQISAADPAVKRAKDCLA